jgi:CubicO group peptidase (beta-lactamase class C family)
LKLAPVYVGEKPMTIHDVTHSLILTAVLVFAIDFGISNDYLPQTQPPVLGAGAPHLGESALISATRQKLAQDTASDHFAGAVLIAHNGKPVFAQAYGLADREHNLSNTVKTRFHIGSMNKMFTAVAIVQLAQQGKLDFDDPVGKYLKDYPNQDIATKVTIRHLLTHRAAQAIFLAVNLTLTGLSCVLYRTT